jgi:hypothetical protein
VSEIDDAFSGFSGDPVGAKVMEQRGVLEPANRRIRRLEQRDGRYKNGVSVAETAAGIALALRRGDQPGARALVEAGSLLFNRVQLIAAVGQASHDPELADLRRAQEEGRLDGNRIPGFSDRDMAALAVLTQAAIETKAAQEVARLVAVSAALTFLGPILSSRGNAVGIVTATSSGTPQVISRQKW